MVYLPTFGWFLWETIVNVVNIPYMDGMGMTYSAKSTTTTNSTSWPYMDGMGIWMYIWWNSYTWRYICHICLLHLSLKINQSWVNIDTIHEFHVENWWNSQPISHSAREHVDRWLKLPSLPGWRYVREHSEMDVFFFFGSTVTIWVPNHPFWDPMILRVYVIYLGGGNSTICYFHPAKLGRMNPILTHIFQDGLKPPTIFFRTKKMWGGSGFPYTVVSP